MLLSLTFDWQFYIHARHMALSRAFPDKFKVDPMGPLKVRNATQGTFICCHYYFMYSSSCTFVSSNSTLENHIGFQNPTGFQTSPGNRLFRSLPLTAHECSWEPHSSTDWHTERLLLDFTHICQVLIDSLTFGWMTRYCQRVRWFQTPSSFCSSSYYYQKTLDYFHAISICI